MMNENMDKKENVKEEEMPALPKTTNLAGVFNQNLNEETIHTDASASTLAEFLIHQEEYVERQKQKKDWGGEKEEEYNPENHDIEVKYGENIKVYNGKMDYYYDHEKFLCLKNIESGEMYCLDKQQGKIQYEANTYEDMLKFVRQRYQIEIFGWKDIFRK